MTCCQIIVKKLQTNKEVGNVKKLIPNLGDKTNYVLQCRNLQLYSSLGMKLTKILRVLTFKQSDWMKKYIDFLTLGKEQMMLIVLKKTFLMINSVYGKAMEIYKKESMSD